MRTHVLRRMLFVVMMMVGLIGVSSAALAAAVVYEPFDMEAGSLNGKAGGTGISGNWSINQTVEVQVPPTLDYGNLGNAGGQVRVNAGNNTWAAATTTAALADAGLLDDGATLWFSLVLQKNNQGSSNDQSGFAFGTGRVNSGASGVDMEDSGYGLGAYTRSGVQASSWSNGSRSGGGTASLTTGEPSLVVGKMVWGATEEDDETITIWTRPLDNIGTEPTEGGATRSTAGFDQSQLNIISFGQRNSGGDVFYDEIRFGATFAAVTPPPPPTGTVIIIH